jgi:hypothetical protein
VDTEHAVSKLLKVQEMAERDAVFPTPRPLRLDIESPIRPDRAICGDTAEKPKLLIPRAFLNHDPQVEITNETVQVIRMHTKQFRSLGYTVLGLVHRR